METCHAPHPAAHFRHQCPAEWFCSGAGGRTSRPVVAIKRGELPWQETERWRQSLHSEFDRALLESKLSERPDYEIANGLLIKARRAALSEELP